jgi:hypothetical protein
MSVLWLNPLVVAGAAAFAAAVCVAVGAPRELPWLGLAAVITLLASEAALALLLPARGRDAGARVQLALAATVAHLLLAGAGAGAVMLGLRPGWSFTWWIAGFFWLTLAVVARGSVRAARGQVAVEGR